VIIKNGAVSVFAALTALALCICRVALEIREEEAREYYQRGVCQVVAVPESVSPG